MLHIDHLYCRSDAPNCIFCGIPGQAVRDCRPCYEPLVAQGLNVFALDYAGQGESEGNLNRFSLRRACEDLDALTGFIRQYFGPLIFLFGGGGLGGVVAQQYAARNCAAFGALSGVPGNGDMPGGAGAPIVGLAQYGVAVSGDASPVGISSGAAAWWAKGLRALALAVPGVRISSAKLPVKLLSLLGNDAAGKKCIVPAIPAAALELFSGSQGVRESSIIIPTLVFKPWNDPHFSPDYVDAYYANLACSKRLVSVDGAVAGGTLPPQVLAAAVGTWFKDILAEVETSSYQ